MPTLLRTSEEGSSCLESDHVAKSPTIHKQSKSSSANLLKRLARPGRLERPTCGFVVRRSIQLSYGRVLDFRLRIVVSLPLSQ